MAVGEAGVCADGDAAQRRAGDEGAPVAGGEATGTGRVQGEGAAEGGADGGVAPVRERDGGRALAVATGRAGGEAQDMGVEIVGQVEDGGQGGGHGDGRGGRMTEKWDGEQRTQTLDGDGEQAGVDARVSENVK